MTRITREQSDRSPCVDFDFESRKFKMEGESFPEDAAAFFGPLLNELRAFLGDLESGQSLQFDFRLSYFNSSSAKALMNMFQLLEKSADRGVAVEIRWHYQAEDETMEEFGEDFAEDIEFCTFTLCPDTQG